MLIFLLKCINGFRLLFLQLHWRDLSLQLLVIILHYNNVTYLSSCQSVYHWLILCCYLHLCALVTIRNEWSSEFMSCFRVTFWFYQNHTSPDRMWLFLKPLFSIAQEFNANCANLTAFGQFHRYSHAFNGLNLNCSKGSFVIRTQMQNLAFFNSSFYNCSRKNNVFL